MSDDDLDMNDVEELLVEQQPLLALVFREQVAMERAFL